MFDFSDDVGMAELLALVAIFGVGGYFVYKFLKTSTCIASVGAIPGITGATQQQVQAAATAGKTLKPGGATVWSCGSDFDYLQPCGQVVTEARHNWADYIPIWNAIAGTQPVTYTDVPVSCYVPKNSCFCTLSKAVAGNCTIIC